MPVCEINLEPGGKYRYVWRRDPAILAVQLMVDEGVHRVLVVDEGKRLLGIVTPIDVCKAVRAERPLSYSASSVVQLRYTDLRV